MAKRIDDYVILEGETLGELRKEVINYFKNHEGYELIGGIAVKCISKTPTKFYQTAVKYQN